jgi:hypothetical protein
MSHSVLIQNKAKAKDVSSLNRSVICASAIDNGWIMAVESLYTDGGDNEVWLATQPTTGSLTGLWMAYAPEVVLTDSKYKGIDPDPRNFVNSASQVFDAFKLEKGDIITLSYDALLGSQSTNKYAIAGVTTFKFEWFETPSGSVTTLRHLEDTYISIGSGSQIGTHRTPASKFEVLFE